MSALKPAPTETAEAAQIPSRPEAGADATPTANEPPPEPKSRRRVRRLVRGVLIAWWSIIGFVGLALLGNILVVPLAQSPDHWWDGVQAQIASLTVIAQTYPLQSGVVALVVLVLTLLSFVENRALRREQDAAAQQPIIELEVRVSKVEQIQAGIAPPPNVVAPTGMPLALSFVGRGDELRDVKQRLTQGDAVGVFALEGIPGVGKTALAAEVTRQLAADEDAFPGGAIWIPCEGRVGDAGLAEVWTLVANAIKLDVSQLPDAGARRVAVASALAQAPRRLITLDNVEPGKPGDPREPGLDADAVIDTLSIPGHTALLLTARQAVAPSKVSKIELRPLPQPDAERLFIQRLQQQDATRPAEDERGAIPTLVAAMDGLPLAVELTAAYAAVTHLKLAKVVDEVEEDGLNAAAFRQDPGRALVVRFDRSWRVLTARQRRLFAGLSLLARTSSSFPRAAALALGNAAANTGETADPAGDLAALEGYALVEALPGGERLRLHPKLREYAASKLRDTNEVPADAAGRLGDAMVAYWLAYAEGNPGYKGMDALEAEADGLMGALEWAHNNNRFSKMLALGHVLNDAWTVRGRRDNLREMIPWELEAAAAQPDQTEGLWATHEQAMLYGRTGQVAASRDAYQRILDLAIDAKDLNYEQLARHGLAVRDAQTGRLDEARAGYARALELARQLHDPSAERAEVHALAVLDANSGRLDEARAGYARALDLAQQLHDPSAERAEVHELAVLDAQTGRLDEARAGYARALDLAQQLHDPSAERAEVHALAIMEDNAGNLDAAIAGYDRALELARSVSDPAAIASELRDLGELVARRGESARGRALMNEALAMFERLQDPYSAGLCHLYFARLDVRDGDRTGAIAHYREALRRFEQVRSPDAEVVREALRELEAGG